MVKPRRPSSPGGGSNGDASRLNRAALRRSALRFGRNTLGPVLPVGAPPSRALSAGRLPALGAHPGSTTGCQGVRATFRSVAVRRGQYAGVEAGHLPSGCARTPTRGSREVGAGRGCGIHVGMARCHRRGFRALARCRPEVGVPSRRRHLAVWRSGGTAFPRQLARGRRSPGSAGCGMVSQETGSFSPPTRSDGRRDAARAARTHTRRGSGGRRSPRFQRRARRSP